jgi:hypothetical protein
MVVLVPALLFLYFGFEIEYESLLKIYSGLDVVGHEGNEESTTSLLV